MSVYPFASSMSRLLSLQEVVTMKRLFSKKMRLRRHFSGSCCCWNKFDNNKKEDQVNIKDTVITFGDLRKEVLEELKNKETVAGVKWKRFPSMTKLLKGHREGELTVLTGPTGSGKTTFLSEYSLDLCEGGVKTLFGNFELKNVRIMKLMLNQFSRRSLDNHLDLFDKFADEFEKLPMHYMKYHGSQNFEAVLQTMQYAVKELNVKHIIIDNLQFMMGNRASTLDRFTYQDHVVSLCRSFVTDTNTHVTIVIHPRKEITEELSVNSIFGGGKATQEADNILIIQRVQSRKFLEVAKNRYDGELGTFKLFYNKERHGFGFSEEKKKTPMNTSTYFTADNNIQYKS